MNSCVYTGQIKHRRVEPRKNSFTYNVYFMYLDMDELEEMQEKLFLFSLNSWNIFSFFDKDHFKFLDYKDEKKKLISREKIKYNTAMYKTKKTKERIRIMIDELGLDFELAKVYIMTNLRNFGYIFNPVSFYYCFDKAGKLRALFSEVNNTFHDQKMYYIEIDEPDAEIHSSIQKKNYYISPFTDLANTLHWNFSVPRDNILMKIDSLKNDKLELVTIMTGEKKDLSNAYLFFLQIRYPFYTLMIIFRIHYQALKLWWKKVPFNRKDESDEEITRNLKKIA